MDFLLLKPEMSAKIPVFHPITKKAMPGVNYTLASKASPEFRAAQRAASEYSDEEEKGIATFAGAVLDWEGFQEGNVPIDPSMENKRRFLKEYDWWLKQVIKKLLDDETFLPNARNASASLQPSAVGVQPKSEK
jgi:hypothetical protein